MRRMIFAALALSLATPLIAANDAEKASSQPKKEKRICRKGEPTGSRLVVRTCHTEAEWAQIDREAALHAKDEISRQQTMSHGDGSGFNGN